MITPEQHAEIRRLYYGEHWKVGTIAAALGVHHETVRAALVNDTQGMRRARAAPHSSIRTCHSFATHLGNIHDSVRRGSSRW